MAGADPAPRVLIVSNARDAHVPLVTRHLEALGVAFFVLNTETFGTSVRGGFAIGPRNALVLRDDAHEIDLDAIRAIWYRRPEMPEMANMTSAEARQFGQEEQKAFCDGLLACIDCRWLSRPEAIRMAGHKLRQLRIARDLGFTVPPTLVSQSPSEIRAFHASVGRPLAAKVIGKGPPRAPRPEDQYVVLTQRLEDADLQDSATLEACATLYQAYVDKAFELRVTVVGEEVFACRIDSQATERTRVDWRNYDLKNTPHSSFSLDAASEQRCLHLVRHLGLSFGAIDLIVTPADEVVFLEINPNGQWGWIEELTGMPIAEAHARFLCDA
jgi:glutathione synthase/RimK-type ligase-like ATP-grasp enzyme